MKILREGKKQTNGDRLRNSSDEDLADELLYIIYELFETGIPSREFITHWLRQEATK